MPGPTENPNPASWQGQIVNWNDAIDKADAVYIDEDAAIATQGALDLCKRDDDYTVTVLVRRYRDGVYLPGLNRARRILWRWL